MHALKGMRFNRVIANAGMRDVDQEAQFDPIAIRALFEVNALAPLRLINALESQLAANSKVILISTRVASHQDNSSGGEYGYRMSKAALNMAGINLAIALCDKGTGVFMLHPGFVRTDLTKGEGLIDTNYAAKNIIDLADELTLQNSGSFWHAIEKKQLPW